MGKGRRGRARLPRDLAVHEPYVSQTKDEELAEKFDKALGIATARSEGWNVVERKQNMDDRKKPEPKKALSMADANAALDAVLPKVPAAGKNGSAAPVSKNGHEKPKPYILPPTKDEDLDDLDEDLEESDEHDEESEQIEMPDDGSEPPEEEAPPVTKAREPKKPKKIEPEPEEPDAKADESDETPVEDPKPTKRPRRAGRGMGRTPKSHKVVNSVNPLLEEAAATAAAELAPHPGQDGGEDRLDDEDRRAIDDLTAAARSPATLAAYRADLRQFSEWCAQKGIRSFPAEPKIVAAWAGFLAKKRRLKYAQIERKIAAISAAHAALEHLPSPCQDPVVKNILLGIKSGQVDDQDSVPPLTPTDLGAIMTDAPKTARWRRNKAMLLLGFSAALRRSELVEVRLEGIRFDDEGLVLAIPGRLAKKIEVVRIPKIQSRLCAVGAVANWIATAGITGGYLFRTVSDGAVNPDEDQHLRPKLVTKIVKEAVKLIGLDPRRYTGSSLRAGYAEAVQEAARNAFKDIDYMRQTLRPQAL